MISRFLTTYEASLKYHLSTSHLRRLLEGQILKGRQVAISKSRQIWLIEEVSLRKYKALKLKPGPKRKK